MKFIGFIPYLKDKKKLESYLNDNYPEIDYYNAEVYLKSTLDLESELFIFDDEKIEGLIEMFIKNRRYINLFTLDYLFEIVSENSKSIYQMEEIAEKVINFRINDA